MASAFVTISKCSLIERYLPVTCRVAVCAVFIVILASLLQRPDAVRSAGAITERPIPAASIGRATEITTGSDGKLWFLETTSLDGTFAFGQIQRMTIQDPSSFTPILVPDSRLVGITSEQFGEILFAEPDRNKIGRIFPPFDQTPPQIEEIDISP